MDFGTVFIFVGLGVLILTVVFWGSASHAKESSIQKKGERLADLKSKTRRYQDYIDSLHRSYLSPDLRMLLIQEQAKQLLQMRELLPQDTSIQNAIDENLKQQQAVKAGQYQNNAQRATVAEVAIQVQAKLKTLGDFLQQLHQRRELSVELFKHYYESLRFGFMQAEADTEVAVGKHAIEQNNVYAAHHHFNRALGILQPNNINNYFQEQINELRTMIAQIQSSGDQSLPRDASQSMHGSADKQWGTYMEGDSIFKKKDKDKT